MAQSKFRLMKQDIVKEISKKISQAQAMVIAEYRGLTVAKLEKLRNEAKSHGIEIKIYKNRLFRIAARQADLCDLDQYLVGSSLFAFGNTDDMSAAKVLVEFAKKNKLLVIKAGTYENKIIDANGVKMVASLPTYEESLAILARSMMAPLQQLSLSLKLIVDEGKLTN